MIKSRNASPDIETRMREGAPALPLALRRRTLQLAALRVLEQEQRQLRLQRRMMGAIAGVLTIQWLTLSVVDAQNTQLIAGNSPAPLFASMSLSQINQLWHHHSRELAQLMEPSGMG